MLHSLVHFLIGFTLVLKGADKLSHHPFIGAIILLFGIIILVYFFYLLWKKKQSETLSTIAHLFEALACLFVAYIFFTEGAVYLPYLSLAAALGFFISVFVSLAKHRRKVI